MPTQYLSIRYGRNSNSSPFSAALRNAPSFWSTSRNTFNSLNLNHNWVLPGAKLNEVVIQFASFKNAIPLSSPDPLEVFPNSVAIGANPDTPQNTEQTKWQFRDDFSWSVTGMGGLGHDFKTGVNFIYEPHLFATFNSGVDDYFYIHLTDERNGPIQTIIAERRNRRRQRPVQAVRRIPPGRLARLQPADAEPRPPLQTSSPASRSISRRNPNFQSRCRPRAPRGGSRRRV